MRHPSYTGFFWWAVGLQILLGNALCVLVFAVVLWRFFWARIVGESLAAPSFTASSFFPTLSLASASTSPSASTSASYSRLRPRCRSPLSPARRASASPPPLGPRRDAAVASGVDVTVSTTGNAAVQTGDVWPAARSGTGLALNWRKPQSSKNREMVWAR